MSKQKKLLGVSGLNLNIKPYQDKQEEIPKQEPRESSFNFNSTYQTLLNPSGRMNEGIND